MRFTIILIFISIFFACKKYPEGPSLSFKSRSSRISNTWSIEKVLVNNAESTPFYAKYSLAFNDDASFSQNNGYVTLNGKWSLISNDDSILVTLTNSQVLHRFKILKLKSNSMWLIESQNTSSYEWHLK